MWTLRDEIISNSNSLHILFETLSEEDGNRIKRKVIEKHQLDNPHPNSRYLFEKMNDCSSTNRSDSISLLKEYSHKGEIYIFFEESKDKTVFKFRSLPEFLSTYENCAVFTVYITDVNCNFLISLTSELTLVCNSMAADWLDSQL